MTKLPRATGRQIVAALHRHGFETIRVRGSHHFVRHADGRCTVVPIHSDEVVGPGLLTKVLRDCELTRDDLAGSF